MEGFYRLDEIKNIIDDAFDNTNDEMAQEIKAKLYDGFGITE